MFGFFGGGRVSTNSLELGKTLAELRRMGRLERIDAARIQMLRTMARTLDAEPSNAQLWRQYREALKELTTSDDTGAVDEALAGLFSEVRDS